MANSLTVNKILYVYLLRLVLHTDLQWPVKREPGDTMFWLLYNDDQIVNLATKFSSHESKVITISHKKIVFLEKADTLISSDVYGG